MSECSGAPGGMRGRAPPLLKPNFCFKSEVSKLCKCSTCCYFNTAASKFVPHHTEVKSAGWYSGKRHCYQYGQGRMYPPPAIFNHVFDEYNFSIILNLFDDNKPHTLSTHNRKCTKCIIFSEALTQSDLRANILKKICLKVV